ncbi:MAG: hypothetical protein IJS39_15255 [Synergistaceae bacterium]|nr:hypothetical protein [Synergistaceae bacterium]
MVIVLPSLVLRVPAVSAGMLPEMLSRWTLALVLVKSGTESEGCGFYAWHVHRDDAG